MSKQTGKKQVLSLSEAKPDVAAIAAKNDGVKAPAKEQKRLNVNIDADLHRRFKGAVVGQAKDMTEVLTSLMEDWLAKNE